MDKKMEKKCKILEQHTKQLNTYGNGFGVLVTREAKAIGLKSGDRVQVRSVVYPDGKKKIIIEAFPEEMVE